MSSAGSETGEARAARVFVSYARENSAIAGEIAAGLRFAGFTVLIDEQSIEQGEGWQKKLVELIVSADTLVCVLSPAYAASPMCTWEVEAGLEHGKRLLPVLVEETDNVLPALSEINWVRLDGARSFMAGLQNLARSLKLDLDWVREHTRLQQRALDWQSAGRPENRLLIGTDSRHAQIWLEASNKDLPAVTDAQRAIIKASLEAEMLRLSEERRRLEAVGKAQRRFAIALGGVGLAVIAGLVLGAVQARANAISEANIQAGFVDLRLEEANYESAVRVSASGLAQADSPLKPWSPALELRLRVAAALNPHLATGRLDELEKRLDSFAQLYNLTPAESHDLAELIAQDPDVGTLRPGRTRTITSPDRRRRFKSESSSGKVFIETVQPKVGSAEIIAELNDHEGAITAAAFSPDSQLLVSASEDGELYFWSAATGDRLGHLHIRADRIAFDTSGHFLRTWSRADDVYSLFELHNLVKAARPNEGLADAYIARDGQSVLVRRHLRDNFRLHAPKLGAYSSEVALTSPPTTADFAISVSPSETARIALEISTPAEACKELALPESLTSEARELVQNARDVGVHQIRSLLAIASAETGALTLHSIDGDRWLKLPSFGTGYLDAKFSCDGRALFTIDESGAFLRWRLQPLIDLPRADLIGQACAGALFGRSALIADELNFADAPPCPRTRSPQAPAAGTP